MNLADLSLFLFTVTTALTAGISAAAADGGWMASVFVVAGLIVGFWVGTGVRWLMHRTLTVSARQQGAIADVGVLSIYLLLPIVFLTPVILGTGVVTEWLMKQLICGVDHHNNSHQLLSDSDFYQKIAAMHYRPARQTYESGPLSAAITDSRPLPTVLTDLGHSLEK